MIDSCLHRNALSVSRETFCMSNEDVAPLEKQVQKINALEQPYDPDDEELPERWNEEHVGRRLIDAFRTLRSLPGIKRPRDPGGNWPQYAFTTEDRQGWDATAVAEKNQVAKASASSLEIWRMEQGLGWIDRLRSADTGLALTVQEWAAARASERPILYLCQEKRWAVSVFYKRLHRALGSIAGELNRTYSAVF